jgi:hypothetical protein
LRVKCPCGSHLFLVHTPPPKTEPSQRKVYLICEGCRKIWRLQDGYLPDVDENGVLKTENEVLQTNKDALVRGAVSILNGSSGNSRGEGPPPPRLNNISDVSEATSRMKR